MSNLENYKLIEEGMNNREIEVNGNKSGESAHRADLYEIPQWAFMDVQRLAKCPGEEGKDAISKSSAPILCFLFVFVF